MCHHPPPLRTSLSALLQLTLASLSLCLAMFACDSAEQSACSQDSDCREGYRCDLTIYVGECIQQQQVISCGDTLCFYPQERCAEERCVPNELLAGAEAGLTAGVSTAGVSTAGVSTAGVTAGDQAGVSVGGTAGTSTGGEAGVSSGVEAGSTAGVSEPLGELSVVWSLPEQGARLSLTGPHQASGQVLLNGAPLTAMEPQVRVELSALSPFQLGEPTPVSASVSSEGRFEGSLRLPAGPVMLIAEASVGEQVAQAYRQVTLDEPVRVEGAQLVWGGEPYRALGADIPRLLPWLWSKPEAEREAALTELWAELRGLNVRFLRTFVGWTSEPWATLSGAQAFGEGAALLDQLLESAAQGGIKLIFTLTDPSKRFVGYADYVRWSGVMSPTDADERGVYGVGRPRDTLLSALTLWPARFNERTGLFYREDPTLMGWELMDEPRWADLSAQERSEASSYLSEAMELLRMGAPQQLLWTGELGLDYNPTPYGSFGQSLAGLGLSGLLSGGLGGAWVSHLSSVTPSVNSVALDMEAFGALSASDWRSFGVQWLRGHALAAASSARPLSVTHARLIRAGVSATDQEATFNAWSLEALSQAYSTFAVGEVALEGDGGPTEGRWPLSDPATRALFELLSSRWSP